MPFRHIALLTLDGACDPEDLAAALRALPATIPELRTYTIGVDAGLEDGNATLAVVADFEDAEGYLAYRDHPDHRAVGERILAHLVYRAALQHSS